ncbi:serine/threonine protein kinase [Kibdelosporangium banguiense]|uniref:non-specific serine/threonine protein kinase n=1 Tax=Kibdelosporangium banguiense TaxID=1365924 RepID=A0ABS4TIF6_9PSEU|nr:serine/threonine-protein kinase [Kibdelosporangium banguiense]MBP2324211.1 serine/threonine protein kinase [Kibdelosporangium banguiense]
MKFSRAESLVGGCRSIRLAPSGTRTRGIESVIEKGQLVAGRYRLLDTIGSGAMGIVWQARDERLDRTVAIKQLLMRAGLSDSQTEDARRRAMREGRIAARLQHRNAIALFDVAEHDGDPCLIMEYLPSRSLSGLLADRGTLSPQEAAQIGEQVATALTAAHAAGIVHRDVKPGNILIDDTGQVKITDFGISRSTDDGTMTQSSVGMLAGTPAYLAPEVARGQDPTRASDVFSLGATLYHALEGQPPYGFKDNPLAQLYAVAMGNVPEPKHAGPLTKTLMTLLSADAADRPTMPEVVTTLSELAGHETVVVHVPTPPKPVAAAVQPTLVAPKPVVAQQQQAPPRQPPPPTPPPPVRPVPPAKQPGRPGKSKRGLAVIGAVVAAAVLGGVIASVMSSGSPDDNANRQTPGVLPPSTVTIVSTANQPPPQTSTTPPTPQGASEGGIDWSSAGRLVINYYGSAAPEARWGMLSAEMQQTFGSIGAFQQFWAQYPQVSSRNANGVRENGDGSVTVPVDVTYASGNSTHKEIRVIKTGGQLKIASDGR